MVKEEIIILYRTSSYWKLYCNFACAFCCTHEGIKFFFSTMMCILSSVCKHNMKKQWITVSGHLGYYGASVIKWIQTCEGNKVSSSSRFAMPRTLWTLKVRTLLCLKMSLPECTLMQHHIPKEQKPQVHCYRSLKICTHCICWRLQFTYPVNTSDQTARYRTCPVQHIANFDLIVTKYSVFRHPGLRFFQFSSVCY